MSFAKNMFKADGRVICEAFIIIIIFKDFIYLFDRETQPEREYKQGE